MLKNMYTESMPRTSNVTGGSSSAANAVTSSYRWVMLALVWLPYAAFGLVSRSIAPLVTPILADLRMSYGEMGLVLGSWQLTYIIVGVFAGSITDRFGVRKSVFAGAVIMGLSAVLRYFASGFFSFLLTVMLFGAGAPLISIGAPTAIAHWFSGKSRGTAVGVYTTSPSVGGLIALSATNSLVMPLVGFSWRLVFVYFGLTTLAIAVIWLLFARDALRSSASKRESLAMMFIQLVRIPSMRLIFLGGLLAFATSHGLTNWLPKLFEVRGSSASEAGLLAAVPMFTGIFSVLILPAITPSGQRGKVLAALALADVFCVPVLGLMSGFLMPAALAIFGVAAFGIFPLLMLILMDMPEVGKESMGLASGIFFAVAEIGGFSGPLLMGSLYDASGSFLTGIVLLSLLNVIIAGLGLYLARRIIQT